MRTVSAKDAKSNFGRLIDLARTAPTAGTKHDREFVVVLAVEEYARLIGRPAKFPSVRKPREARSEKGGSMNILRNTGTERVIDLVHLWFVQGTASVILQKGTMRYSADITAGALKLPESRHIADLLLRQVDAEGWADAIFKQNVLQARSPATARRLAKLIRGRLETMGPDLWKLVRDGKGSVATHAAFAAAVKHSPLLADFLRIAVGEQYGLFATVLSNKLFDDYLEGCRERDPDMPLWNESTRRRLRSSVFQMLAQAGYIENTRNLKLRTVHIADQVLGYLRTNHEDSVLRSIQVSP